MSESTLDQNIGKEVRKKGGLYIKLLSVHFIGLPDRLVILPNAKIFFAEIKVPGKNPSKIQKSVHKKINNLGFEVYIIRDLDHIKKILDEPERFT